MPAVVVVTIAVPAAAKAVHAITQPVPVDVSVAIGILEAPTRTHPMLITAVGILPLIALVVVAIALHPVVVPVVYTVSVSILITVLASFIVAIIVVIVIVRPRHGAACERQRCCQSGHPESLQHSPAKHNHLRCPKLPQKPRFSCLVGCEACAAAMPQRETQGTGIPLEKFRAYPQCATFLPLAGLFAVRS